MPADMGVAIVILNHLTLVPTQLHEILPRFTSMPVELITENLVIEPNHVFIIPSNRDLHVDGEVFQLKPISKPRGWPDVADLWPMSAVNPTLQQAFGAAHCVAQRQFASALQP